MSSEVRSGDLEANLSSNAGTSGVETYTAVFVPLSSRPSISTSPRSFYTLQEECSLREDTFLRFRDRFQFLRRLGFVFLGKARNPMLLPTRGFVSIRLPSCVALGFLSIRS